MKKQTLDKIKSEILNEVEKQSKSKWHRHPIFILILGFVLTTLLGSIVSSWISKGEMKTKQGLLYLEKTLDTKLKIIKDLNYDLGLTLGSVEQLVHNAHIYKDSIDFRKSKTVYAENILDWRAKSNATKANLRVFFNSEVVSNFEKIDSAFFYPSNYSIYINGIYLLNCTYDEILNDVDSVEKICITIMKSRNFIKEYIAKLSVSMESDLDSERTNLYEK